MQKRLAIALAFCSAASCIGPSPADLPRDSDYLVVVNSVQIPEYMQWYTRFAEHAWIDVKNGAEESWTRMEVEGAFTGVEISSITSEEAHAARRWDNRVSVLEVLQGKDAALAIGSLLRQAKSEPDFGHSKTTYVKGEGYRVVVAAPKDRSYEAWPGPNSNTFVASLVESTPGLRAELHHNSVGKDYPRDFRAGITSSGYGVEADVGYIGVGIGLRQGVELHLVGLTAGIGLWPPALKVPFLPRIGIHQGWVCW